MPFHKFACDGPYATGAVRTRLDPKGLAYKLTRHKMPARVLKGCVDATCNGDRWTFNEFERAIDKTGGKAHTLDRNRPPRVT